MKKFISIILFFVLSSLFVWAQEAPVHEFSAYSSFGLSSFRYKLSQGNRSGGIGGDFGVGYTWYRTNVRVTGTGRVFNERWGIYTGLGVGLYGAKSKFPNGSEVVKDTKDSENDNIQLHSKLSDYKEKQRLTSLNIPVMAQFQIQDYYAMAGLKLGIPLGGKYKTKKNATITNEAYYPEYENWLTTQKFAGYGVFDHQSDGDLKFGVSVMLTMEGGMNWRLDRHFSLYTGLYFDVGLNNAAKNKKQTFVDYHTTGSNKASFSTNSMMTAFTEKANLMAVGVKVRLAYVN